LFVLGVTVTVIAFLAVAVRFSGEHKADERKLYRDALAARNGAAADAIGAKVNA
jgi:hypothetical protein